ncbi:MAG TPA: serine protease [Terriglobales bacterium]|nr:serine protease [Terriglobales bacterium]
MLKPLRRGSLLFAIPMLLCAQTPPKPTQEKAAGEIYKTAGPSVVLIETYAEDGKVSGSGSGFLVSADGEILTNFHVIAHTKRATVRLANEDAYDYVGILDVDKRKDIALLKIKAVNLPYLKLSHSGSAQVGDKLYTLGNPLGVFQNTLSEGLLSGIRQMDGYKLYQLSAPISHGSSGSPVFNSQGDVIGIVEATLPEGQNLNFAIPIDYAAGMLDSREVRPLTAFYEPEEAKQPPEPAAKEETAAASPSTSIKQDPFTYISNKIGIWTKEDAEVELGKPVDRRDAIVNNAVVGDIFKYDSPKPNFSSIELNINRTSKKLAAAYFYYAGLVSWKSIEQTLGKNYKKQKVANGRPIYLYQFQGREVSVIVDSANNVYNIGVW